MSKRRYRSPRKNLATRKKDKICLHIDEICDQRGGRVVTCYESCDKKMTFECAKGHRWDTRYSVIKSGSWCPKCVNRKTRRGDFVSKVESLGGQVVGKYVRIDVPVDVKCEKGHEFQIRPSRLFYKNLWCDKCSGKKPRKKCVRTDFPRRPYKKGPRCEHTIRFGKNKGSRCRRKSYQDGLCRYHINFRKPNGTDQSQSKDSFDF